MFFFIFYANKIFKNLKSNPHYENLSILPNQNLTNTPKRKISQIKNKEQTNSKIENEQSSKNISNLSDFKSSPNLVFCDINNLEKNNLIVKVHIFICFKNYFILFFIFIYLIIYLL